MLDKSISIADRRQFTAIRDPQEWRNPFLLLNSDGSITVITGASHEQTLLADELKQFLLELSPAEWPFGRVVSIRPCSARSEDKARFEEEDRLLKVSWGVLRDVMRSLQLEMNMWPSGETTHAMIKREDAGHEASAPRPRSVIPVGAALKIQLPGVSEMHKFMCEAIDEAKLGSTEGGIPIGSVLIRDGKVIGRGHNRRVQNGDPIAHAEIECLKNAGRLETFRDCVLYSTLMPCAMCAGAAIQFGIPLVVAGEDRTFPSARKWMEQSGVRVVDLNLEECSELLKKFAEDHPAIWHEDIGEENAEK